VFTFSIAFGSWYFTTFLLCASLTICTRKLIIRILAFGLIVVVIFLLCTIYFLPPHNRLQQITASSTYVFLWLYFDDWLLVHWYCPICWWLLKALQ
jgi:hypothetical protein